MCLGKDTEYGKETRQNPVWRLLCLLQSSRDLSRISELHFWLRGAGRRKQSQSQQLGYPSESCRQTGGRAKERRVQGGRSGSSGRDRKDGGRKAGDAAAGCSVGHQRNSR